MACVWLHLSRCGWLLQAYPLDLVRTRLSAQTKAQYYTGIAHALRTIARDEGLLGLYRGLWATLLQVTPSLAINYTAYGTLRSHWLTLYGQESNTVSTPACLLLQDPVPSRDASDAMWRFLQRWSSSQAEALARLPGPHAVQISSMPMSHDGLARMLCARVILLYARRAFLHDRLWECSPEDVMRKVRPVLMRACAAGDHEPGMRRGCRPHIIDRHISLGPDQAQDAAGGPRRP